MKETPIRNYAQFWPYYLSQHSRRKTQILHAVGLILGLSVSAYFAFTARPIGILAGPVVGYGFAWYAHFFVEKNRPATWEYPLWSFVSDFRLTSRVISGRVPKK